MKLTGKIQDDLKGFSRKSGALRPYKVPRTWVMVIDQHVARLFKKGDKGLEFIGEALPDMEAQAEFTNKSVGRVVGSIGKSVHHKYEPHLNASRHDSLSFVRQVSDWLDRAVWEDAFDRIVLVAAPRVLGELRKVIKQQVHARVIAEINKDLTKLNENDLREELTKIAWF